MFPIETVGTNIEITSDTCHRKGIVFSMCGCTSRCFSYVSSYTSLHHYQNSMSSLFNMVFFLLVHYPLVAVQYLIYKSSVWGFLVCVGVVFLGFWFCLFF